MGAHFQPVDAGPTVHRAHTRRNHALKAPRSADNRQQQSTSRPCYYIQNVFQVSSPVDRHPVELGRVGRGAELGCRRVAGPTASPCRPHFTPEVQD